LAHPGYLLLSHSSDLIALCFGRERRTLLRMDTIEIREE